MRLDQANLALSVTLGERAVTFDPPTLGRGLALHGELRVPYVHIAAAEATAPEWPAWWTPRLGTHWPRKVAIGTFWEPGVRRFYYLTDAHDQILELWLEGMKLDGARLVVPGAAVLASEIAKRARVARGE